MPAGNALHAWIKVPLSSSRIVLKRLPGYQDHGLTIRRPLEAPGFLENYVEMVFGQVLWTRFGRLIL